MRVIANTILAINLDWLGLMLIPLNCQVESEFALHIAIFLYEWTIHKSKGALGWQLYKIVSAGDTPFIRLVS